MVEPAEQQWALEESLSLSYQDSGADDFVRDVARRLFVDHEVWIELAVDAGRAPEPRRGGMTRERLFEVAIVHGLAEDPVSGRKRQVLPRAEDIPPHYSIDYGGVTDVDLSAARLIHVELPSRYSGDELDEMFRELGAIPEKLTPDWVDAKWMGMDADAPTFDVQEHIRLRDLLALQATHTIGWTAREIFMGDRRVLNDYAHFERELRFLHFRASLRAQAEEALVQVLGDAAAVLGLPLEAYADGVLTPAQVEDALDRFRRGALPFSEVSDLMFEKGNVERMESRRLL
ncbi:MAG: hypothetical protein C4558_07255 [Dehalococcoidia bacterium]|nr:MAG: hypothetical protein C4558_07255 [Dehalococcoidia bacterium]